MQLRTQEYFFDNEKEFTRDDGFGVAAAVTSFDGSSRIEEDPDIGTIKFYLKYWSIDKTNVEFGFKELPSKLCGLREDYSLDSDDFHEV